MPNLSAWRRKATGDMTGAFDFKVPPKTKVPSLPTATGGTKQQLEVAAEAVLDALTGTADVGTAYPAPTANHMPQQATRPRRPHVRQR